MKTQNLYKKFSHFRKKDYANPLIMFFFLILCMILVFFFESIGIMNNNHNVTIRKFPSQINSRNENIFQNNDDKNYKSSSQKKIFINSQSLNVKKNQISERLDLIYNAAIDQYLYEKVN